MKSRFITAASSLFVAVQLMLLPGVLSQSSTNASCYTNLTLISETEGSLDDLSVPRKYILCPDTIFVPALVLRANATVQCGDDGSSANSCVFEDDDSGASFSIGIAPALLVVEIDTVVENVLVQGVTVNFITASIDPLFIPVFVGLETGDVTFKDCIFSNLAGEPMFVLNQFIFQGFSPQPVSFTFDSCRFESNFPPVVSTRDEGLSLLRFAAIDPLMNLLSDAVEGTFDVILTNNVFINNDFAIENDGVAYRSMIAFNSSGDLKLEDNCFINSPVSSFNASSIVILFSDPTVQSVNNFLDVVQTELPCPYMVDLDNDLNVQCRAGVVFNATTCASDPSFTVTPATTDAPTPPPSKAAPPTAAPTAMTSAASPPYADISFFGVNPLSTSFAFSGLVTIMFVCEMMMP